MSTVIMLSFVIPAIVAAILTGMLIKEKDYFFQRREMGPTEGTGKQKKEYRAPDSYRNHLNRIDFSDGSMGI